MRMKEEEEEGGGRRNYIRRWLNVSQRSCSCIFFPSFPPTQKQQRCNCLSPQRLGVPLRLFTVSRGRTLTSWGGVGGYGVGWGGGGGAQWVTRRLRLLIGSLDFLPISAALQTSAAPQLGRTACQAPSAPISQFPSVLHLPSALHLWYFNDVATPFNYF